MATKIPTNLKYTDDHEWIDVQGDTTLIGVTDFAQSSLGDIVFLELPEIGASIEKGSPFGVVESIKSVSDLYAPVTGEVVEVNQDLIDTPENVNNDPYNSWMIKIKISDSSEINDLMDSEAYTSHCENQE